MSAQRARSFFVLIAISTAFAVPSTTLLADGAPPDPRSVQVDRIFAPWDSNRTPGCAVGVFQNGEALHARGYGMANLEHDIVLSPDSVFRIASTSKQFTAMTIALLHQRGELSLDDSLARYFPEFPEYAKTITLRHLVHHTSGLRDYLVLAQLAGLGKHYTGDEALDLLRRQKAPNFPPGEKYLYSNSGYFLLGQIVRMLPAGKGLEERAHELIFEPLGMNSTHFHSDTRHLVRDRAEGHNALDDGTFKRHYTILEMIGDGGVYSTINDLRHWNDNFEKNRLEGGEATLELVTTRARLNDGNEIHYAFGLRYDTFRGTQSIGHSGSYAGFRTALVRFPAQHLGIAVLCNRNNIRPYDLAFEIGEIYLENLLPDASDSDQPMQTAQAVSPPERTRAIGSYWNSQTGMLRRVFEDGDRLFHQLVPGGRAAELIPLGEGRYRLGPTTEVRFEKKVVVVEAASGIERLERFSPETPKPRALERFVGTYYSEELDAHYRVSLRDGTLVVHVPRTGEYALDPQVPSVFTDDDLGAFRFSPGEPSPEFELDAGRVRDLRFVRPPS